MDAAMLDVVGGDGASDDVAAATRKLLQRDKQGEEGSLCRFLQTPTFKTKTAFCLIHISTSISLIPVMILICFFWLYYWFKT